MNRKLILTLIITLLFANAFGQVLKYRVGANGGMFQKEIGPAEVEHPLVGVLSSPNATDFTSNIEAGFEAEVMVPWTLHFETGIELEYTKFSGYNDVPPYYNYYFAPNNPTVITTTEPLIFESSAISAMANFRYYVLPDKGINPFLKVFGGVSFVAAEFNYKDPAFRAENNVDVLYAIGTKNSQDPREPALYYGGGVGISFQFSEKLSLYIDGTAAVINSDKVNGIPNYDYSNDNGNEVLTPVGNQSLVTQVSIGIVFTSGTDLGITSGSKKGIRNGIKRTGRTSQYFPFYRQK